MMRRVATRLELLRLRQRYKRTRANDLGPYPVPLSFATVSMGIVGAVLVTVVGIELPLLVVLVTSFVLCMLPLEGERIREQWTWTAWLGTVAGSAVALALVTATALDHAPHGGWLPWVAAIALPLLVVAGFVARNAPRENRSRLRRLLGLCGSCAAAIVIIVIAIRFEQSA